MAGTRDLRHLPKAELHLHLNGSMRPSTLRELCSTRGISCPPSTAGRRFDGFSSFEEVYQAACRCIQTEADLARLVLEVAEDAKADGVRWIEPALSGHYYDTLGGVDQTLDIACRAAAAAEAKTGVGVALIVAADRSKSVEQAIALAKATVEFMNCDRHVVGGRPRIVGFGLHANESGHPPDPFVEAFRIAREDGGLRSIPHGGELGPDPGSPLLSGAESVRVCVDLLGAARIGHGVLAVHDASVLELLRTHRCPDTGEKVCLDVCPSSNYLLRVVKRLEDHPLPRLLAANICVTINSDDSLLFGPRILEEYCTCREKLGLSDEQLAAVARQSFRSSCAPPELQEKAMRDIDAWLLSGST